MPYAMRLDQAGDPAVLHRVEVARLAPGPGEVWLEQEAVGVNYLDVMQRRGAAPIPLPGGLGLEAAGRVAEIGAGVDNVAVGDRVVYALGPLGAYASGRIYPAERLVKLPSAIDAEAAAAVFFKGLTAQYLLRSTYPVGPGKVVLIYGAAGGLGQILARWSHHLGATVIGVVSKPQSIARAEAAGCQNVLVWGAVDLAAEVARLTGGARADVVYDGIGRDTFAASLDCLRPRGMMVSIGASSGAPDPVPVGTLNAKGSLFLTCPGLAHHITDLAEYHARAEEVFAALSAGVIRPEIAQRLPLGQAAQAHQGLEEGRAGGTIVLIP